MRETSPVQDHYEIYFSEASDESDDQDDAYEYAMRNPLRSNPEMRIINIELEQPIEQDHQDPIEQHEFEQWQQHTRVCNNEILSLLTMNRQLQRQLDYVHATISPPRIVGPRGISGQAESSGAAAASRIERPCPSTNPPSSPVRVLYPEGTSRGNVVPLAPSAHATSTPRCLINLLLHSIASFLDIIE